MSDNKCANHCGLKQQTSVVPVLYKAAGGQVPLPSEDQQGPDTSSGNGPMAASLGIPTTWAIISRLHQAVSKLDFQMHMEFPNLFDVDQLPICLTEN